MDYEELKDRVPGKGSTQESQEAGTKTDFDKADLFFLSEQFENNRKYSEKEVNDIIKNHHSFNDIALLRRELVSRKFLARKDDCSIYWKV